MSNRDAAKRMEVHTKYHNMGDNDELWAFGCLMIGTLSLLGVLLLALWGRG